MGRPSRQSDRGACPLALGCVRLSVSADERKNRASSEIENERKRREERRGGTCKRLFKYLNLSTQPTFCNANVKISRVTHARHVHVC